MKEKIHKKKESFGIEQKISKSIARLVITFNMILGLLAIGASAFVCIASIRSVLNESSAIAAELVTASLKDCLAIAYETGSIARLADPERSIEDKKEIIEQRVNDHDLISGMILDANGRDIFTGEDYSNTENFTEAMNGNTHVSTPAYDDALGQATFMVSAPLWEGGIPHTTPIGAIVYLPNGETLNDIMRSIQVGEHGTAFMSDDMGLTIADIDSTLVGTENLIEQGKTTPALKQLGKVVEKMAAGETGVGIYLYHNEIKMASYSPVPEHPHWSIGICVAFKDFATPLIVTVIAVIVLVIAFMVVGLVIGRRIGKTIAMPIGICVDRLNLLSEGNLEAETVLMDTNDETETLMKALDSTINSLNGIVKDISHNLEELSEGNLTIDVSKHYRGNFAQIGDSFRSIVTSLNQTMKEINGNADQVSKGSDDVAGASQCLADGATEQTDSIHQLTDNVDDISMKIQQNAHQAEEVKEIVDKMNDDILQSNKHMQNMTSAMERISETSNEIAAIMRTIEDIAGQTNLLSLNASIEAARAGEAGRGFAIVADQVRTLAEQTSVSAKETAVLIENELHAVEEGASFAKITSESLEQVVQRVNDVRSAVDTIAEASKQQAAAAEQITYGVEQITSVVESNSATAQESAASSEELSELASHLKNLLGKFKFN